MAVDMPGRRQGLAYPRASVARSRSAVLQRAEAIFEKHNGGRPPHRELTTA